MLLINKLNPIGEELFLTRRSYLDRGNHKLPILSKSSKYTISKMVLRLEFIIFYGCFLKTLNYYWCF